MKNQDELILKAPSLEKLPEELKVELPEWCSDESTFQQYKQVLRISKEIKLEQPILSEAVKTSLDQLFQEKRRPNWFLLNVITFSGSTNSSQKALWMSLAAVLIIVLVSSVFIWHNTSRTVKQTPVLNAKVERSKTLETSEGQSISKPEPSEAAKRVSKPLQFAAVEVLKLPVDQTESENFSSAESPELFSDIEISSSEGDVLLREEVEITKQNKSLSLADPIFDDVLNLLEPTF